MKSGNLFLSWLAVKAAIVGLLFILLGFNYIFSMQAFWYDKNFKLPEAQKAIAAVSDVDQFDQFGYTALMMACGAEDVAIVDLLIKKGADVNLPAKNDIGDSALHVACRNMKIDLIDLLLKNNANPLLKNKQNVTPFALINLVNTTNTGENFKKALNLFIAKGVDINYPDIDGRSLLFSVIDKTQSELLNLLQTDYAHLVNFDLIDKSGRNIVQFAADKGDIINRIKPLKLERLTTAMDVNSYDPRYSFNKDFTLTLVATIKGKHDYLADAIKNFRANVNLPDKVIGGTCLHWACLYNWPKCIEVLVKGNVGSSIPGKGSQGAGLQGTVLPGVVAISGAPITNFGNKVDANFKDKAGQTPIHCLWGIRESRVGALWSKVASIQAGIVAADAADVAASRTKVAKLLFEAGANFNAQDDNGNTFLHNAVLWVDFDFVKLIATDEYFTHRVNFNLKNKNNKTAFEIAQNFKKDQKSKDIADLLKNYNNINYVSEKDKQAGITPLMLACMRGDQVAATEIAKTKENLDKKDKNGDTPLHFAIRFRNPDVAKILIKSGAKVGEKNNLGDTPLNEVINIFDRQKREEIIKLLLDSGAVISENKNGDTLMHLAVRNNMPDLIMYLKQNFGKMEKNKEGKTAYDLAKEIGQKEKIDMSGIFSALEGVAAKK